MNKINWETYALHDEKHIHGFFGKYRFLSNFHLCDIDYEGLIYPSTEHAFQAAKYASQEKRFECLSMSTGQAKSWGQEARLPNNWNEERLFVMYKIQSIKYTSHRKLQENLLLTFGKSLCETNHWMDNFWGCDYRTPKLGKNNLGRILEIVRWRLEQRYEIQKNLFFHGNR